VIHKNAEAMQHRKRREDGFMAKEIVACFEPQSPDSRECERLIMRVTTK
jgi:hypothetical protein